MELEILSQKKEILWAQINELVLIFEQENKCLVVFLRTLDKKFDFTMVIKANREE